MKQKTIAGKDTEENKKARKATSKVKAPQGKGTNNNYKQPTIAGKDTEENKKARKATSKAPEPQGKGTDNNVKQPTTAGKDTSSVVKKLSENLFNDLTLTESELSEINEANYAQKAKDQFMSMKKANMSSDDMVDIMVSLAKSKQPKDRKVAEELAELLANDGHIEEVAEAIERTVSSKGEITKRKDRKTRKRRATQTTGLSKSKRRQIARKAARTKKKNPSGQRKAARKAKIAKRKRKAMGIS
ncbi:MAG: hypothetical protein CL489_09115 [Acidobacteria bacterium]|nr:hypothetical protein [Acidobacteriota bacterium]